MERTDPHDLARFVAAQDAVWTDVLAELGEGGKRSHWMWFVFPQMRGLGRSAAAQRYGIGSADEARAYLAHPALGTRLHEATGLVLHHRDRDLRAIFGTPDDLKFVSSMTLFDAVADRADTPFARALDHWCDGERDGATLRLLAMSD